MKTRKGHFSNHALNDQALKVMRVSKKEDLETDSIVRDYPVVLENGHFEDCIKVLETGESIVVDPQYNHHIKSYYRVTISRVKNTDNLFVFFSDVSAREEQKLKDVSTSKLATIGEMAGGVAHEINTPIQMLSGYLRRLGRNESIDDDGKEALGLAKNKLDSISRIVKNLKKLSRGSDDQLQEIAIEDLVMNLKSFHQKRLEDQKIDFIVNSDLSHEEKLVINETSLHQIITNLVNNSIDSLFDKDVFEKFVRISLGLDGDFVHIKVQDNGIGIDKNVADRVFDPLFTTKEVGKGTGLGLSLSKRLAINMGGDLYLVEDELTTFILKVKKV
ncbi:MAG: HAMP domain-containing histidine kinase [Oligoflexia bacterium]|nr:HAMP domain-containing histidine kinase [Oligoflexia bacterium]